MSGPTARELAQITSPLLAKVHGMVRRMSVSISKQLHAWQVTGVKMVNGDEVFRADVFSGVGFVSRPPLTGKPEAIVVMASGGVDGAALVGARDLKTAQAVVREVTGREYLEPGEALNFTAPNGGAVVYMKADGTTEVRSSTGTAVELATKADVEALKTWLATHVHGGSGTPPTTTPPTPAGTTKLKGE